jgi:hypothetical protein
MIGMRMTGIRKLTRARSLPCSRPTTNNWSRHFGALGVFPPSGRDRLLRGNPDRTFSEWPTIQTEYAKVHLSGTIKEIRPYRVVGWRDQ